MHLLWQFARRYWRRWVWGWAMLVLTNLAAMAIPQLFRLAVDDILGGTELSALRGIAVVMVAVAAAGAVVRSLSRVHIFYAARDVELDLRCALYQQLTRKPASFFASHATGDLMSRATNDLTQVRLLLGPGLLNVVNTIVAYAMAVPLMALISPKLTLLTLAVYPPSLFVMHALSRRLYTRNLEQQAEMGNVSTFVQESIVGAHVVRAFARESAQLARFDQVNADYYAANVRLAWTRTGMFELVAAVGNLGVLLAVFFGARDVLREQISVGELVAAVEYMAILAWPTYALGWMMSIYQRGRASMQRLAEIFDADAQVAPGVSAAAQSPSLAVRGLTVELGGRPVVEGVSFELEAGQTLGVVGPVGAGKSTLVRALMGEVPVARGSVELGGIEVTQLELDALRGSYAHVPQHNILFSKTLADNVAFGRPEASREQVLDALAIAAFDRDLRALPKGLDTLVGERGVTLSGGQKQRVSLARAVIMQPPVLVLDDALSSVDSETETRILEALRATRKGRTNVIVSHRISAVQHADQIIVLDHGHMVERGRHDELMLAGGLYAQLARRQRMRDELDALGASSGDAGVPS